MKKGFTLIELLAVIVILAIIALIAVPIVLSIIEETKESATLRSAEYYLDAVEQSIMKKNLTAGGSFSPNTCEVQIDGNLLCDEKDTLEIEVSGETPSSGRVAFNKGKVINISLKIGDKIVLKNEEDKLVIGELLADYIKNLYSETTITTVNEIEYSLDETHSLMNDRLGSNDVAKTDGNIRYYGASPNNYIDIGDRDSEGNIIFWRIIGLFKDVDVTDKNGNVTGTEDLVKIIRAENLTSGDVKGFSWDCTSTGEYDNNWKDSTLQVMLNNAYYKSGTTDYYIYKYNPNSQIPVQYTLNFASTGLSSEARNKVERVKWDLGSHNSNSVYTDAMYGYERTGINTWSGKVALMYPSDYGYSVDLSECQVILSQYGVISGTSPCSSTNWIFYNKPMLFTLTSSSSDTSTVFMTANYGILVNSSIYGINEAYTVRPVMYLKSNVGVVEEKETSDGLKYLVIE